MAEEKEKQPKIDAPSTPPRPATKLFDVALVDVNDPSIEHWPRMRISVAAATVDDLTADQKAPPPGGESQEGEARRLAFLVSEIERQRAIDAYNALYGLVDSHLRYDVAEAKAGTPAPIEPPRWKEYREGVAARNG